MSNFTTTTSAVFIPEIWSNRTLDAAESKLVAANLVSRYDADVSAKGDTVHIPEVGHFSAARDKSADTDLTLDTITEDEKVIYINKNKYKAFAVEDIVAKQSQYDLVGNYTKQAGYAIAKAVDTDLLSLYSEFTTDDAGSYEADISASSMVAAIQQLMVNDVPREDLAFIIHSSQAASLMNVQNFATSDYMGEANKPTVTQTGPSSSYLYGTLYGIPVYYTNNVQNTSGTTTSVHNVLIHREAWALAMQMAPRVQMQYDIRSLADIVAVDILYGVKTTRPDFGVELRSTT